MILLRMDILIDVYKRQELRQAHLKMEEFALHPEVYQTFAKQNHFG